jgi:YfiR/HmsC-like
MVKPMKASLRVFPGWLIARWLRGIKFPIGAVFVFVAVCSALAVQAAVTSEYDLKAAFVFNFVKFTEWPAEELGKSDDPFIIGVLGKDPFGAALDKAIEGETVHNKKIVVRRFPRMDQAAANSHTLFISGSEEHNLPAILKILEGQAVLTVSEITNFSERGGVIELKKENSRIGFEINILAAKRAGLGMNAQLLRLAKVVRGKS